jgi:hypothetical protein
MYLSEYFIGILKVLKFNCNNLHDGAMNKFPKHFGAELGG